MLNRFSFRLVAQSVTIVCVVLQITYLKSEAVRLMEGTFHRRELKAPSISFSSTEGKEIFRTALKEEHMEGYFHLAEHYVTQGHPAFCGIGSLTMALNSLLLDPQRVWQGVWRWFDESMLDCCESLDVVRMKGITLPKLSCLARCNGAHSTLVYGDEISLDEFREDVILISTIPSSLPKPSPCCALKTRTSTAPITLSESSVNSCCDRSAIIDSSHRPLREPARRDTRNVMICSYNRRTLKQTGTGHFSPIGGYCAERDLVLILDVARFKYPPHWVPLAALYEAMKDVDPETGRCRGYILLSSSPELEHKCECATGCGIAGQLVPSDPPSVTIMDASITAPITALEVAGGVEVPMGKSAEDGASQSEPNPMERVASLLGHSCSYCT